MAKTLKPLTRAPLLHVSVQDAIKDFIFENNLQPGDALPSENELADQLGVSRNSVREAVKSLVSLGVVESRRGSGLYVQSFSLGPLLDNLPFALMSTSDLQALEDLLEVRRILEVAMIERAMQSFTDEDIAYFDVLLARMLILAQRGQPLLREDPEFHQHLFHKVGNAVLLKLLDIFWIVFRKASQHAGIVDAKPMSTYLDHVAIVEAIKAGDVEAARLALDRHYAKDRGEDSLSGRIARIKRDHPEEWEGIEQSDIGQSDGIEQSGDTESKQGGRKSEI
jgi:DNA-binding FadR family transcriptional regulator